MEGSMREGRGRRGCSCREQPEGGSAALFLIALHAFIWVSGEPPLSPFTDSGGGGTDGV